MQLSQLQRINVVGTSGSGKSTFSRQLANTLNSPYVEMDRLHWKANWQEAGDEELFAKIQQATASEQWVLDGNYNRTEAIKWERVQTVIWVDFSFARTFYQALKRALYRAVFRPEIWPDTGNKESIRRTFFSKESVLLWMLQNFHRVRQRYVNKMEDPKYRHIHFVRLRSSRQASDFIAQLKAQQLSSD